MRNGHILRRNCLLENETNSKIDRRDGRKTQADGRITLRKRLEYIIIYTYIIPIYYIYIGII